MAEELGAKEITVETPLGKFKVPRFNGDVGTLMVFSSQVSGHTAFFRIPSGKIIKQFSSGRELWFYANLHKYEQYHEWIPSFYGCVKVSQEQCRKTEAIAIEHAASNEGTLRVPTPLVSDYPHSDLRDEGEQDEDVDERQGSTKFVNPTPWALRLHRKRLAASRNDSDLYLVLRDRSSAFRKACILDIKMGKITMGQDSTETKRKRHKWKCSMTTSASMGIRISGMRVYNMKKKCFTFMHKYEGRALTPDTISEGLFQFFHNGEELLVKVLDRCLEKLQSLLRVMENDRAFDLYSSSLLLMYDGDAASVSPDRRDVDLCLIDFSQSYLHCPSHEDDGFLLGLRNLIRILTSFKVEENISEYSVNALTNLYSKPLDPPSIWEK
tara:strand:+ start:527 stop:1672 length:1146 start_codon:yes stop_codon:yes gene_type:complete